MHEPGCYYTQAQVSELLVAQIQHQQPERVLDLGAGHGALVKAAKSRWPKATIHAIEPNGQGHAFLRMRFPDVYSQRLSGLDLQLVTQMGLEPEAIDVAVCNPPYLYFKNRHEYQSVFIAAGLPSCPKLQTLTTDVLFLAQNLRLLRKGGELGIIVPDGLLTNKCFQLLREDLLNHHQVFGIIQLPENVFSHTEARTHILLVRRNGVAVDKVPVHLAGSNGHIVSSIDVDAESLAGRMDFQFWHWLSNKPVLAQGVSLASIGADIKRGQFSKKHYENLNFNFFHTSNFPNYPAGVRLSSAKPKGAGLIACKGDILLARVGKRCIGKVAIVTHGQELITDCVYRIRVPLAFQKKAFNALSSESGQRWLKAYAHGVCAQVISKADLLEFQLSEKISD